MNFRGLAERLEMEEGDMMEIIGLFLEASASDLRQLQSAIDQEDVQSAVRAAHSIKGAAANLRLTAIFEIAQRMERRLARIAWRSHRGDPGHPGEFEPDR